MATKVIIEVEGGVVQDIKADGGDIRVIVVDKDIECYLGDNQDELDDYDGEDARIREWCNLTVGWSDELWDRALTAADRPR
jgi:hypothetical protein